MTLRRRKMLSPWGFQHRRAQLRERWFSTLKMREKSAAEKKEKGKLVRKETRLKIVIGGMHVSKGILTTRGGMTSHRRSGSKGDKKCCGLQDAMR